MKRVHTTKKSHETKLKHRYKSIIHTKTTLSLSCNTKRGNCIYPLFGHKDHNPICRSSNVLEKLLKRRRKKLDLLKIIKECPMTAIYRIYLRNCIRRVTFDHKPIKESISKCVQLPKWLEPPPH